MAEEEEEEGEMLMVVDQLVEIKSLEHSLDCGFSPVASEQQNGFCLFPPLSVPWCHGGESGRRGPLINWP